MMFQRESKLLNCLKRAIPVGRGWRTSNPTHSRVLAEADSGELVMHEEDTRAGRV